MQNPKSEISPAGGGQDPQSDRGSGILADAGLWAPVLAAAFLRFVWLGQRTLWVDELATLQRLGLGFAEHVRAMRGNHPLYEVLLRLWASAESSDVWIRLPSAALGVLAVWLTWLLLRSLGRREAAAGAWFMALSPLHVMYSRIARSYSLAVTLALLSNITLLWALKRRRLVPYLAYVLCTALMVYANLVAGSIWVAQGVFLLWFHRKRLRRIVPWVWVNVSVALLLSPWIHSFLSAMLWGDDTQYTAQQYGRTAKAAYQALTLCLGETVHPLNGWIVPAAAVGFGMGLAAGALVAWRRRSGIACFLLSQAVVVYAFGLYFGAAAAKHLAVLLPAWLGLIAIACVRCRARLIRTAVPILVVATMCASLLNYYAGREFADADMVSPWREITRTVRTMEQPADGLIVGYRMDRGMINMFSRYYRGALRPEYLDFDDWRGHIGRASGQHATTWLLLHDGDPWNDIEAWLADSGRSAPVLLIQEEEHTLQRIREQGIFSRGEGYRSHLYRLYRIRRQSK